MSLSLTGNDINNSTLFSLRGNTLSAFRYSPFGATPPQDASATPLPGFNGERADPLTGVTHLGNGYRAFSPALFRFTCPDSASPFGEGGINAYAYCENDPVNMTDPSGHGLITMMVKQTLRLGLRLGLSEAVEYSIVTAMASAYLGIIETTVEASAALATGIASTIEKKKNPVAAQKLMWASIGLGGALGILGAHHLPSLCKALWRRLPRRGPAVEFIEMRPRVIEQQVQQKVFVGYHGTSTKYPYPLHREIDPVEFERMPGPSYDQGFYTCLDYSSAETYALHSTRRSNGPTRLSRGVHQPVVYDVWFDNTAYQGAREQEININLVLPGMFREAPAGYEARFTGAAIKHLSLVKRESGEGARVLRAASLKQKLRL